MLDVFKTGKRLLFCVGTVRSEHQNLFANFRIATILFLLSGTCILQVMYVIINWESIESLGKAELTPLFSRNVFTIIIYASLRQDWKKLMKSIKSNFWDVKTLDPKFQAISHSVEESTAKFARFLIITMIAAYSMYVVKPAFTGDLPFAIYQICDINQYPCYLAYYLVLSFTCVGNAMSSVGFDMIYFYVIQKIYVELEAIKFYLGKLDCSRELGLVKKEVAVLVNQHVLILSAVEQFRRLVRIKFIILHGTTTISICFGFFLITLNGIPPPMESLTKYGLFLSAFIVQIIVYCIGGTILLEQSLSVSRAVYNTNWFNGHPSITKSLSLMILRANKEEVLDIGGIIHMNLELFPEILKTAFSFYTLMDSMYTMDIEGIEQ